MDTINSLNIDWPVGPFIYSGLERLLHTLHYTTATLLKQIKEWLTTHHTTVWGHIESTMILGENLKLLLFSTAVNTPSTNSTPQPYRPPLPLGKH